jgi:hypothetical protein
MNLVDETDRRYKRYHGCHGNERRTLFFSLTVLSLNNLVQRAHRSAGAAERRARPESDRETNATPITRFVSRPDPDEPAGLGRGLRCRPARRISPARVLLCWLCVFVNAFVATQP